MSDELKVTPASEFRKMREKGVALTLPTGRNIRMRGVDPSHFIRDPEFTSAPVIFQRLILDMFWKGEYSAQVDEFLKPRETAQETADVATSFGIVAKKVLIKPVLVETLTTDDDQEEVVLSDFHGEELATIFRLAFLEHRVLYYLEANGLNMSDDGQPTEASTDSQETGAEA